MGNFWGVGKDIDKDIFRKIPNNILPKCTQKCTPYSTINFRSYFICWKMGVSPPLFYWSFCV